MHEFLLESLFKKIKSHEKYAQGWCFLTDFCLRDVTHACRCEYFLIALGCFILIQIKALLALPQDKVGADAADSGVGHGGWLYRGLAYMTSLAAA